MTDPTPQLDPSELYDKRRSKDAARLRAYNKILEQIYNRIRSLSKLPNSQCNLLYTVPPFILGLPKIDLEDCVVYLIYQLRHAGYEIRYTPPNMIYISWLHHEKSYLVDQSPIMQAMLVSAEKTQSEIDRKEKEASRLISGRKSGKKVRIQTPGHMQGPMYGQTYGMQSSMQSMQNTQGSMYGQGQMQQRSIGPYNMNIHTPSRSAINTVLSNPTAGPPPPSAAEYIPPPIFLQQLTNPQNTVVQPKSVPDYFKR
jgi:hypothetical protein